jgi:type VI secretion system protein ImpI
MTLTLQIENETSFPDGGPLSVSIKGRRGLDIGRDPYLDWTLPDPSRFISGRHCEVRWHDGAYWLHDISTNGTFLNGAESRLKAPHRVRNGDRFVIGQYIIAATLEEEAAEPSEAAAPHAPSRDEDLWNGGRMPPIRSIRGSSRVRVTRLRSGPTFSIGRPMCRSRQCIARRPR